MGNSKKRFEAFDPQDPLQRSGVPATELSMVRKKIMEAGFIKIGQVFPTSMPARAIPAVQRSVLLQLNTLSKFNVTVADIRLPLPPSALRAA